MNLIFYLILIKLKFSVTQVIQWLNFQKKKKYKYIYIYILECSWQSSGWEVMLPVQRAWVRSLIWEARCHRPCIQNKQIAWESEE